MSYVPLPCHQCGAPTDARKMMCVEVKSHEPNEQGVAKLARVNMQRWWCFCSDGCRDAWYAEPTDELFATTGPPTAEHAPCDDHEAGEHDFQRSTQTMTGLPPDAIVEETEDGGVRVTAERLGPEVSISSAVCSRCGKAEREVAQVQPSLIEPGHADWHDRYLRYVAWHVEPGTLEAPKAKVGLHDEQIFDHCHDLNAYWKAPLGDPSAPKD